MSVAIALIAAIAENGVIGHGDRIPWYLPGDFAHFKRMTVGKPIIMGRRTFESIGRPLPDRTNIVVSRQPEFAPVGAIVIGSVEEALTEAQRIAVETRQNEVMVCGGAEIYRQAMPLADRMYLTMVEGHPEGDVIFPPIDFDHWTPGGEIKVQPHPNDSTGFRVQVYRRSTRSRR
jgi:dihydrofolate reductase